ncbi:hypothetical protein TIFTF001_024715 [Ficus carica]|uniref:Uncharacterized protein n=1 Tax=Ficus carica TaxID=3494 RepID=A0AA88B0U0_FICCA|nr:hypothetical protein TIFTF001_024715 [Ficus carica]
MPNSWRAILGAQGLVDQEDMMKRCAMGREPIDVEDCPWTTPLVWGRPESFLTKVPPIVSQAAGTNQIQAAFEPSLPPSQVAHKTRSSTNISVNVGALRRRLTPSKSKAPTSSSEPIMLDETPLTTLSPVACASTFRPPKCKREDEEWRFALAVLQGLSHQENHYVAYHIGCQITDREGQSHSKLTEEGRDQYTFDWSHARLDTLRQYCNDKLVDKEEVNADILRLASYFSDAEDEKDKGHLDEVVEEATRQADGEEVAAKELQEEAKEINDGEAEKK